jgi:hypothetical protein
VGGGGKAGFESPGLIEDRFGVVAVRRGVWGGGGEGARPLPAQGL